MKLNNPTDDQLNAAFAEHVAGWKRIPAKGDIPEMWNTGTDCLNQGGGFAWRVPRYSKYADAVLPWLEKWPDVEIHRVKDNGWQVSIMDIRRYPDRTETGVLAEAWEDTIARAICIALLRANGVEVEVTP